MTLTVLQGHLLIASDCKWDLCTTLRAWRSTSRGSLGDGWASSSSCRRPSVRSGLWPDRRAAPTLT